MKRHTGVFAYNVKSVKMEQEVFDEVVRIMKATGVYVPDDLTLKNLINPTRKFVKNWSEKSGLPLTSFPPDEVLDETYPRTPDTNNYIVYTLRMKEYGVWFFVDHNHFIEFSLVDRGETLKGQEAIREFMEGPLSTNKDLKDTVTLEIRERSRLYFIKWSELPEKPTFLA